MKYDKINKISSESVEKATGKSWSEWISLLDKEKCADKSHKEIAQLVYDKYLNVDWPARSVKGAASAGWWAQMITVGYEYAKGKRVVGETLNQGFEIGVQKVLPVTQEKLWKFLNSKAGKGLWQEDAKIEIRTKKEPARMRLKYNDTTLQIYLECNRNTPEKTHLSFHQEKLKSVAERNRMRTHWKKIISKIEEAI